MAKSNRPRIDKLTFVQMYLQVHREGGTIQDVADRLGMAKNSATVKASQIRQLGYDLPVLKQQRQKTDLSALAKMVSDYQAELSCNLEGKEDCTISDHLDEDVQGEDDDDGVMDEDVQNDESGDEDDDIPGRGLVNSAF